MLLLFQIQPSLISQLKTVRQLAISRLMEFFEQMTDYDFKPICEAVFSSAVWPQVNCTSSYHPRMFDEIIWSQFNKTFTSVIYKCSYCFWNLKQ